MDEGHKKPYEILLLGRFSSAGYDAETERREVPEKKVLVSVPCSLHSKKPPLAGNVLEIALTAQSFLFYF